MTFEHIFSTVGLLFGGPDHDGVQITALGIPFTPQVVAYQIAFEGKLWCPRSGCLGMQTMGNLIDVYVLLGNKQDQAGAAFRL